MREIMAGQCSCWVIALKGGGELPNEKSRRRKVGLNMYVTIDLKSEVDL